MKRHAALQSLSREHHSALVLALACKRAAESGDEGRMRETSATAVSSFATELEPHFREEEHALLPLLNQAGRPELVQRTLDEHMLLRGLVDALNKQEYSRLAEFGKALSDHVRFEENELFPGAEQAVPAEQLVIALGARARLDPGQGRALKNA